VLRQLASGADKGARRRDVGLARQFAVLSVIPMLVLGVALGVTVRHIITARFLDSYGRTDELTVDAMASTLLAGVDLSKGTTAAEAQHIDSVVADFYKIEFGTASTQAHVTAWTPDGHVLYATDSILIGKKVPMSGPVRAALTGTVTDVLVPTAEGPGQWAGPSVETTIPLRLGGHVIGAVQSLAPLGTMGAAISHGVFQVELVLVLGLLLLWAVLFPIVVRASHRLRRQAEENERLAMSDALTGLANRTLFHDRLSLAFADAARRGERVGLLMLDLDRFKEVNDTLGHAQGDRLLCEIGDRLRAVLRETDTLARLGGDEFAVVLPNIRDVEAATEVARRMLGALEAPFELDGVSVVPQVSVGIAIFPDDGRIMDVLLSRADQAMYTAKHAHEHFAVYDARQDRGSVGGLGLVSELHRALQSGEIVCYFQPIAGVPDGEVRGAEALVRWQHPERGLLLPGEFIDLAERAGLMRALTAKVIEDALRHCRRWRERTPEFFVSVNLSAESLRDAGLPDDVAAALRHHDLAPSALELEITEGAILEDPHQARELLAQLQLLGVGVALDDFGTGYSSLSYLAQLPVHKIKIDRSFVADMLVNPVDETIVTSVVDLARRLEVEVLAEGVETRAVWDRLADLGCAQAQGFYLGRPMRAEKIDALLGKPVVSAPVS
jgi:diguanylate cyclase (GGDEF)-like protein